MEMAHPSSSAQPSLEAEADPDTGEKEFSGRVRRAIIKPVRVLTRIQSSESFQAGPILGQ